MPPSRISIRQWTRRAFRRKGPGRERRKEVGSRGSRSEQDTPGSHTEAKTLGRRCGGVLTRKPTGEKAELKSWKQAMLG